MTPRATSRSPLTVIFIAVFINLVGFGIVIPILPLYAERFGASPFVIGMLLAVYSLMQCVCAPLLGKLSDRIGRRPVLLVSIIGTSVGFFVMAFAHSLWLLFLGRIIDGITGGNISTAMAYIADVTPPEQRSRRMGLIGAAFGIGLILGPAIGGLLGHVSLAAPFLFAGVLAAANALALSLLLPESLPPSLRRQAQRHLAIAEIFRQPHGRALLVVVATYFCTTVAFSLLTATYPLFTERRFGFHAIQNGYIFASQGLIGAVIQGGLLGWLLKLSSDRTLTVAGTAILTASLFVLPMSLTVRGLLLATAGIAVGHALVAAPLNGLASKSTSPVLQGRVLGVMQSAASAARIIGPVLGGWLLSADAAGLPASFGRSPYLAGGAVMLLAVGLALMIDGPS